MTDVRSDSLRCTLPSHPKYLPLVRALAEEAAGLAGFDPDERQRIVLAVTEAVTNVIRHAYGGDTARRIDLRLAGETDRVGW